VACVDDDVTKVAFSDKAMFILLVLMIFCLPHGLLSLSNNGINGS